MSQHLKMVFAANHETVHMSVVSWAEEPMLTSETNEPEKIPINVRVVLRMVSQIQAPIIMGRQCPAMSGHVEADEEGDEICSHQHSHLFLLQIMLQVWMEPQTLL